MTSIPNYLSEVYSEDYYASLPSEVEMAEVLAAPVEDEWTGYSEWSADIEQAQFEASLEARATVNTPQGEILIKRECNHSDCEFSRCKRAQRIGGIDV
jgi:hypothetical protein